MPKSTADLRKLWHDYECAADDMEAISFGPDVIRVAPPTIDAWRALAAVMAAHQYEIRTTDTDSYNCRKITGGTEKSLHAYGIALDINWTTNPYIDHAGERDVRFSDKPTQAERAIDVKQHLADTDMTQAMIDEVTAIRTAAGVQVFEWGGHWRSVKDCMHFEIDVGPDELETGIDWDSVAGTPADYRPGARATHRVMARDGLRLRDGPSLQFSSRHSYPAGTRLSVLATQGEWAQVDLQGDGLADGYMFSAYLERVPPVPGRDV